MKSELILQVVLGGAVIALKAMKALPDDHGLLLSQLHPTGEASLTGSVGPLQLFWRKTIREKMFTLWLIVKQATASFTQLF